MSKTIKTKYSMLRHRFVYGPVGSINGGWLTKAYYRNVNNDYCVIIEKLGVVN